MAGAGAEAEAGAKNKGERWSRKLIIYCTLILTHFLGGVQGRRRKMCEGRGSNSSVRGHLGPLLISELEYVVSNQSKMFISCSGIYYVRVMDQI